MGILTVEEQIAIVTELVRPVGTEEIPLAEAPMRILAQDVIAAENVPPFKRTPYDGYALRSEDVKDASPESPVTLRVLEEIPAGGVPQYQITEGTAVRIMTGAPIPEGGDCVIMYEQTVFTETEVTVSTPVGAGENLVFPGEDIQKGERLAQAGDCIDAGLAGTLAGQNIPKPLVFRKPKIGLICTGSELVDVGEARPDGMIYDSNRYTLLGLLTKLGCEPVVYGIAGDSIETIREILASALEACDAVLLTGGVSAGDFDYTPAAMEAAGCRILFRGANLKPGMACAYGEKDGKLVCALSGNPVSSMVNFLVIAMPAIKKLAGWREYSAKWITVELKGGFAKPSRGGRYIHGRLDLSDGTVKMDLSSKQGNVIISSTIGSDVMAFVPAGSGPLEAGTKLRAILL